VLTQAYPQGRVTALPECPGRMAAAAPAVPPPEPEPTPVAAVRAQLSMSQAPTPLSAWHQP
jgi:hypothetical protein